MTLTRTILFACLGVAVCRIASAQDDPASPFVTSPLPAAKAPTSRLTIAVQDAPIRKAFEQIKEQTGYYFTLGEFKPNNNPSGLEPGMVVGGRPSAPPPKSPAIYPEDDQRVSLDVKEAPFWETIQKLLAQTKNYSAATSYASFSMSDTGNAQSPAHFSGLFQAAGPFLVLAQGIHHVADFRYDPAVAEDFYLSVQILEAPGTKIAQYTTAFVPIRAVDENSLSLIPTRPISAQDNSFFPRQERVSIALNRPKGAGQSIRLLEGFVTFSIISKYDVVEVPVPGRVEKQYGPNGIIKAGFYVIPDDRGISGAMELARNPNGPAMARSVPPSGYAVIADYPRPEGMSDDAWKQWDALFNACVPRITDANGKPWGTGTSSASPPPNHRTIAQSATLPRSGDVGPAVKATFTVPLQAQAISIPYHFENLILP